MVFIPSCPYCLLPVLLLHEYAPKEEASASFSSTDHNRTGQDRVGNTASIMARRYQQPVKRGSLFVLEKGLELMGRFDDRLIQGEV